MEVFYFVSVSFIKALRKLNGKQVRDVAKPEDDLKVLLLRIEEDNKQLFARIENLESKLMKVDEF